TNTGAVPLANVRIADNYDNSLKPEKATAGFDEEVVKTGVLQWTIESLAPGKTIRREVRCKCSQATARACNRVTVSADDVDKQAAETCVTVVENGAAKSGQPAEQPGQLSLSVADDVDPMKAGEFTNYQIVITNKGPGTAKDVVVGTNYPMSLVFDRASGPTAPQPRGDGIRFRPIAEMRAGETQTYEVRMQAKAPGTAKFRVEVTSQGQKPVVAEETTEILEK